MELKRGTSQTGIQTMCFVELRVLSDKDDLQVVMQHVLLEIDFSKIPVLLSTAPWPKAKPNFGYSDNWANTGIYWIFSLDLSFSALLP